MSQTFQCQSCGGVYVDVQRDGSPYFHACPPLPPDKHGIVVERPDKRDENIVLSNRGRPRSPMGIVAEGNGTTCVTDKNIAEPSLIAKLKARIEAGL